MEATPLVEKRRVREAPTQPSEAIANNPRPVHTAWRVLVYRDSDIAKANRKAEAINEIWPELKAAVFSLDGEPYFGVATGGVMERAGARRARKAPESPRLLRRHLGENSITLSW
jgi:hypothetical protein